VGRPKEVIRGREPDRLPVLSTGIRRTKPRSFLEWKALRRWGKLPPWEPEPAGYLLRLAREEAGLTQSELAKRLGCSQQAVAQAERWQGNPTVDFLRRWADQCGRTVEIRISTLVSERGL
jgi:DNA-binding XRE family transcriptional regulator